MQITVPITDEGNAYILKQYVGEGKFDGHNFELCVCLPTMSPLVMIDGRQYTVNIHDIAKGMMKEILNGNGATAAGGE